MKPPSERQSLPVRLPADLHRRLKERAESLETSMNTLVEAGVRHVLDAAEVKLSSGAGSADAREDLVVAALSGEIGALKGIAQHYGNLGLTNLSSLLYGLSAEVAAATDPKAASKELVRTASRLPRQKRDIAVGLFRAALRHNPENEVAKNHLGQALYFAGEYKEAVKQLASVRDRDNHAKLFHGWASLHLAREAANRSATTRARDEIVVSLEAWAFGSHDARERGRWLRQVAQLDGLGADYQQTVDELLAYANDNTSWLEVSRADLTTASTTSLAEDLADLGTASTAT